MKYPEIEITEEELIRTIYFILMKYSSDPLHIQGTSSKRDLIGGFIERWLNKLAETSIFDYLFREKPYTAISDYFLYDNESKKNAPDILGIKTSKKIIPFTRFVDGSWETVDSFPRIEVKAFRKDQYLFGVRQPQLIDDFYVFVESDLSPDYLTSIFRDEMFDPKNIEKLSIDSLFIKSDKKSNIIKPVIPQKTKKIGTFRLIGTYTKEQLLEHMVPCDAKVSPRYLKEVINVDRVVSAKENEQIKLENNKFTYILKDTIYLPVHIEGDINGVSIIKKNIGSVFLNSPNSLMINGNNINPGFIKLDFSKFDRSSNWREYLAIKNSLILLTKDSTQDMLDIFEKIYEKNK